MVYCPLPTCGARTISEQDSNLAVCQECKFPFCKLCQQTWHGVEPCLLLEKVTCNWWATVTSLLFGCRWRKQRRMRRIRKKELSTPRALKRNREGLRRWRYDHSDLCHYEVAVALQSAVWIRSHDSVKCCPKCQQTIQKHGGCNKMSCLKCGTSFCWLCGNIIQG